MKERYQNRHSTSGWFPSLLPHLFSVSPRCCPWRLGQDSGDEIVKPLGVLLRVDCGDLRSGLEIRHTRLTPPVFGVCVAMLTYLHTPCLTVLAAWAAFFLAS